MKKLFVLALLVSSSTGCGCGRSWFPQLFRGAPCNGLCSAPAPALAAHDHCEGCAPSARGYESYGDGVQTTGPVYESQIVGSEYVTPGTSIPVAPMSPIPGSANPR